MSDEVDKKKELWFQYLSKLNDRTINKRRASGITTWAVAGVLAFLGFQILDRVTLFTTDTKTISLHIMALAGCVNLSFFGILILAGLLTKGDLTVESRLETKLDRASYPAVYVPLISTLFLVAALNFFAISPAAARGIMRWPFVTIGIFFAVQFIGPILIKANLIWKSRKKTTDLPALSTPFYLSDKVRKTFSSALVVVSVLGLAISIVPAIQAMPFITIKLHIETIKWSLQVATLLFLFLWLCFRIVGLMQEQHLEQLERRLITEDLSAEDIKSLYVREHLGQTIRDWLADVERDLARLHSNFISVATDANKKFADVAAVDKTLTYEITGRTKEICSSVKKSFDGYVKYSEELSQKLQHLREQNAFISEPDLVQQLSLSWKKQLDEIKKRYIETCTKCQESIAGLSADVIKNDVPDCLIQAKRNGS